MATATTLLEGADPLRPADPVSVAVVWVEKARVGSMQWSDDCTVKQLQAYRLKKQLKPVTMFVKYALLALAFVEVPSYCILDKSKCPSHLNPELHGAGAPMWPLPLTNGLAICFWIYFIFHSWLRMESLGKAHNFTPWHSLGHILVFIGFLDCIVAFFYPSGLMFWTSFRVSRLVRPMIFLSYTKKVREAGNRIIYCIPKILDVFLALVLVILFFAWIGLIIFGGAGEEGKTFFHSWELAITSLYILFTTANCPDVFLPAYEQHRMAFLFFCSFIIITIYLLSNVLLASVYDAYKEQLKDVLEKYNKHQQAAMRSAFHLIAGKDKTIGPDTWCTFFTRLCDSFEQEGELHGGMEHSDDAKFNRVRANSLFQFMDKDNSRTMDFDEFKMVLDIIDDSEYYMPRRAAPNVSKTPFTAALKKYFKEGIDLPGDYHMTHTHVMDCVILVDVLIVLVQTVAYVNGSGRFNLAAFAAGNIFFWVLFAFSCFYVVTLSLKIWVFGFERFWHAEPVKSRFDFITVYGIFLAETFCICTELFAHASEPGSMLRLIVLLHVSRSLRFLDYIHPLKYIANFVTRLLPTYYNLGMLLIVVFYIYAMIGGQWFGGLIYEGNPVLKGSDFADSKYWSINFNDFPSSMVTLFVLMVINNWFVITDALIKVSGTRWAAAFAVSFFVFVNMIVLNILMALLLEMSSVVSEEMAQEESGEVTHHKSHHNYEQMLSVLLADHHEHDEVEHSLSSPSQRLKSKESTGSGGGYGSMAAERSSRRASM